ncbi:GGDEF domain-containing protein [Deferribacteres bacterium DY0609]
MHSGRRLQENIRPTDYAARWGGEEFIVLMPETSLESALEIVDILRKALGSIQIPNVPAQTTSFGVKAPRPEDYIDTVLARAGKALNIAKDKGRNTVASVSKSSHQSN